MQGTGRVIISSALRRSRVQGRIAVRLIYPRPPLAVLGGEFIQRRGYRRTAAVFKEDEEDKPHKVGKEADKKEVVEEAEKQPIVAKGEEAKTVEKGVETGKKEAVESGKREGKEGKETEPHHRERRTREKRTAEEKAPRAQTLSLISDDAKSRLVMTQRVPPTSYPQCMALAMSGRPILPGFYSILPSVTRLPRIHLCQERCCHRRHP
jgi:hypothetical protein